MHTASSTQVHVDPPLPSDETRDKTPPILLFRYSGPRKGKLLLTPPHAQPCLEGLDAIGDSPILYYTASEKGPGGFGYAGCITSYMYPCGPGVVAMPWLGKGGWLCYMCYVQVPRIASGYLTLTMTNVIWHADGISSRGKKSRYSIQERRTTDQG
jgi:hypothetical protein